MIDPVGGALRWARCAAATAVIVSLSALAHAIAGGMLPSVGAAIGLAIALTPLCWLVVRRRLSGLRAAALLVVGQVGLHEAFMASAGATGSMHGGAHVTLATDHMVTAPMIAFHLVATAASVVVLSGAEQALWSLLAWLAPLVVLLAGRLLPVPGTPSPCPVPVLPPEHAARMVRHAPRRGPPALPAPA